MNFKTATAQSATGGRLRPHLQAETLPKADPRFRLRLREQVTPPLQGVILVQATSNRSPWSVRPPCRLIYEK